MYVKTRDFFRYALDEFSQAIDGNKTFESRYIIYSATFSYRKSVWRRACIENIYETRRVDPAPSSDVVVSLSLFSRTVYLHFLCALREVMQYALASLSKEITKGRNARAPPLSSGVYRSSGALRKKAEREM